MPQYQNKLHFVQKVLCVDIQYAVGDYSLRIPTPYRHQILKMNYGSSYDIVAIKIYDASEATHTIAQFNWNIRLFMYVTYVMHNNDPVVTYALIKYL